MDYPLIATIRDVVIIVLGILWILTAIVAIVVLLLLYSGLKPTLRSLRTTAGNVQVTTTMVSNTIVRPLIRVASVTVGVRRGFRRAIQLARRKR